MDPKERLTIASISLFAQQLRSFNIALSPCRHERIYNLDGTTGGLRSDPVIPAKGGTVKGAENTATHLTIVLGELKTDVQRASILLNRVNEKLRSYEHKLYSSDKRTQLAMEIEREKAAHAARLQAILNACGVNDGGVDGGVDGGGEELGPVGGKEDERDKMAIEEGNERDAKTAPSFAAHAPSSGSGADAPSSGSGVAAKDGASPSSDSLDHKYTNKLDIPMEKLVLSDKRAKKIAKLKHRSGPYPKPHSGSSRSGAALRTN